MEVREFAERILFAGTLEEKLDAPAHLTDERPGPAIAVPGVPGRPVELRFKQGQTGKTGIPSVRDLEQPEQRGRLLHFFANHELLATELMALVLLRFPEAPRAFRRGVLQTLKEEQAHTSWYIRRMQQCGISFGQLPVSGYFWRAISTMESPVDYVAGLSLTFEQANLDYARFFAGSFSQIGDSATAQLLERIYQDEIGHVAYGLKWFRKWKEPNQTDWDAFCEHLKFPMSAQRAKGPVFNVEGRLAAGFDRQFVDSLNVYAQSKGRTPSVFVFNPFAEGRLAGGKAFTPNKHQQALQVDLENLPQFLCRQDDVVLVAQKPSVGFLSVLKTAGFAIPEFVQLESDGLDHSSTLCGRKLDRLCPWAWGPDSVELLRPLFANSTNGSRNPDDYVHQDMVRLYSKEWSAGLLRKVLRRLGANNGNCGPSSRQGSSGTCGNSSWLCTEDEVGTVASSFSEVLEQIAATRSRGHHDIVLKQVLGVAGHNAIRLLKPELLDSQRRWIDNALDNGHRLLVEPWLQRQLDFSVQLHMTADRLQLVGYAGLSNDWKGQYRGNWAWPGFERRISLDLRRLFGTPADISRHSYAEIFWLLEEELRKARYLGPLGIDAFVYKSSEQKSRLKPIVEINPRYTMGRLTLELMKNVAPGKCGALRLLSRKDVKNEGYDDFSTWAPAALKKYPLRLAGEPVPKITEGMVCLNEPARAQVCLAIFNVSSGPWPLSAGPF